MHGLAKDDVLLLIEKKMHRTHTSHTAATTETMINESLAPTLLAFVVEICGPVSEPLY